MRLNYPWLQDPYYESENEKFSKREFLKSIDNFLNQRQYVKITLLDWNSEAPLKSIEGDIVSGSLTKEGSGAVRRAGNMNCAFSREEYNVDSLKMDYSLNKKIFVEIGIKNETNMYQEYPILWFPQGTFVISNISISSAATSAVNVSISFKDKMCLLDGTIGGKFPSTVILDEMDTQTTSGEKISKKVKIYDIIMEVVNHFGKESLENIVIEDIPDQIGRIIRWTCQDYPLYIAKFSDGTYTCSLDKEGENKAFESAEVVREFQYGDDVGYIYEDFVYDSELTASSGSSITSVLDNIKNYLGNFEYFYDEYGVFHFREIKNYLNKSLSAYSQEQNTGGTYYSPYNSVISLQDTDYLMNTLSVGKTVYSFDDSINIISISNSPSYENIKNDFIVHGVRKGTQNSQEKEIFYHLAIDKKPYIKTEGYSNILVYKDPLSGFESLCIPEMIEGNVLPETGDASLVYGIDYSKAPQTISFEVPYTESELKNLGGETLKELTKTKKEAKDALSIYLKEIIADPNPPSKLDEFLSSDEKVCTLAFPGLEYELPNEDIIIGKPLFSFSWKEDEEQKKAEKPLIRWLENNEHFIFSSNFFVLTEKIINTPSFLSTEINPSFKNNVQEQISFLEDLLLEIFPIKDEEDSSEDEEGSSENDKDSSENESLQILKEYLQVLKDHIKNNIVSENSVNATRLSVEKTLLLGECCVNISEILLNHNVFASLYKADGDSDESVLPSSTAFTKNISSKKSAYQKMLKEKEREKALIEEEKAQIEKEKALIEEEKTQTENLIAEKNSLDSEKKSLQNTVNTLNAYKENIEKYYKDAETFLSGDFTEKQQKKYNSLPSEEEKKEFLKEVSKKEYSLKAEALKRITAEKKAIDEIVKKHQGDFETIEKKLDKINEEFNKVNNELDKVNTKLDKVNLEIAALNENLDAIDIEIAWWENYFKLNSLKDGVSAEEEFPMRTVSFNIDKGCRFWYWDDVWKELEWYEYYSGDALEEYVNFSSYDDVNKNYGPDQKQDEQSESPKPGRYIAKDWRTEIILQGLQGYKMGRDKNSYYFEELIANWPSVYNLREQCFRGEEAEEARRFKSLTEGEYFLDFIDSSSNIFGEYCVDNIGRRQNIVTSNEINCLFEPEIWPIGFIVSDWVKKNFEYKDSSQTEDQYIEKIKATLQNEGREVLQIPSNNTDITDYLSTGGILNGAFPQIKLDLLQHTNYQKKLSITAIPVWYLEPNTRVNIKETSTNTFGDFMAQSLSYSLGPGGSMTVTCSETIEKM